jgi:hypothetical protein
VKYTLLGDANLDGSVNFSDFSILQNHYGQAGDWSSGDFNYDGTVNFDDFSILQNNYGEQVRASLVVGSSVASASSAAATTLTSKPTPSAGIVAGTQQATTARTAPPKKTGTNAAKGSHVVGHSVVQPAPKAKTASTTAKDVIRTSVKTNIIDKD